MPSAPAPAIAAAAVSVLFNEPKLLKFYRVRDGRVVVHGFSALQRAEIAEIADGGDPPCQPRHVSVLFNEPKLLKSPDRRLRQRSGAPRFSALQRAEIAEIVCCLDINRVAFGFSALQRAEIAEIAIGAATAYLADKFQCSSTSRNC